ncbi:Rhomboid protease GluP [Poriferisphaera corsica]|uniref:Rhomboid protease GluP n=1 Tax=Poriferisphaera corsica TaxID=2528020 RepID=A0A517YYK6_9BACT|nr:rhomboid family intramembrane serine protease [Poriferisphaera corsica]QDU35298.1 Rhomboid protease GluP [Poriferisphaera corsica]
MLFFPVKTDRPLKRKPWINYALITLNIVIYLVTYQQILGAQAALSPENYARFAAAASQQGLTIQQLISQYFPVTDYYLRPGDLHFYQFFSYQFLHAGVWHLFGNLIFLYVFGNNVEDRLGHLGYLFFYLAAGIVAALGHAAFKDSPCLGASGAIAGVTGAYLALFPLSNITIFYWVIFVVDYFEVTGIVLILFRVAQDILFNFFGSGNVAYIAHISGYIFGFGLCMALLLIRLFPREPYDLLALIERRRRRSQFKRMVAVEGSPWQSNISTISAESDVPHTFSPEEQQLVDLRAQITAAVAQQNMAHAAKLYEQLLATSPDQVLSMQHQLDVANQLMADARYDSAAQAYEIFLKTYAAYPQKNHVRLILGLIYGRYLSHHNRAKMLLNEAMESLDGAEKELAENVLKEIS